MSLQASPSSSQSHSHMKLPQIHLKTNLFLKYAKNKLANSLTRATQALILDTLWEFLFKFHNFHMIYSMWVERALFHIFLYENSTSDLPFVISVQRNSYGLFHEPAWLYIFTLMRTNSCNFEKENGTLKGPPPLMAPLNPSLPEPPRNDLVSWSSRLTIWNWVYNRWTNSLHW